jgi:hypothetical protein
VGLLFDVPVRSLRRGASGPLGRYLHYIGVEIKTGMTAQSLTLSEWHWSEGALSLSTSVTFAPVSGADIPADALVWPHGTRSHHRLPCRQPLPHRLEPPRARPLEPSRCLAGTKACRPIRHLAARKLRDSRIQARVALTPSLSGVGLSRRSSFRARVVSRQLRRTSPVLAGNI